MMKNDEEVKVSFTGDIMCKNEEMQNMEKKSVEEFRKKIENVSEFFKKSDYVVGNLETPLTKQETESERKMYSFNTPKSFAQALKECNFDLMTTANNHCLDMGIRGLNETIDCLEEVKLEHTGTYKTIDSSKEIFVKNIKGIKFAFLSYTYGTNAFLNRIYLKKEDLYRVNLFKKQEKYISKYDLFGRLKNKLNCKYGWFEEKFLPRKQKKYLEKLEEQIENAKRNADIVFCCMHSGGQYNSIVDKYTANLAEYLLKKGVDYVIGNHPHVVLDSRISQKKGVVYSLGNFFSRPYTNSCQKNDLPDYSIILHLYFNCKSKEITKISFSVAKTVIKDGISKVYIIDDLIKNSTLEERNKYIKDTKKIIKKFANIEIDEIREEYILLKKEEKKEKEENDE